MISRVVHSFSKHLLLLLHHHSVTERNKMTMRLTFQTNRGLEFELDVSRDETLEEIKHKIHINHHFPIPSQTLSFNGVTIATDADLHAAPLADGSVIHVAIADEAPAEPPAPPRNRGGNRRGGATPPNVIFVRFAFGKEPPGIPVAMNPSQNASQLRSHLEETTGFKPPDAFIFFHKNKRIKENRTLEAQKIRDGAIIEVPRSSFKQTGTMFAEQLIRTAKDLALPEGEGPSAPSSGEDEDDVKIRVMVEHGDERVASPYAVDVWAAQKVGKLREKLQTLTSIGLPARYCFLHNGNLLNEEVSFRDQNVGNGDLIQIGFA